MTARRTTAVPTGATSLRPPVRPAIKQPARPSVEHDDRTASRPPDEVDVRPDATTTAPPPMAPPAVTTDPTTGQRDDRPGAVTTDRTDDTATAGPGDRPDARHDDRADVTTTDRHDDRADDTTTARTAAALPARMSREADDETPSYPASYPDGPTNLDQLLTPTLDRPVRIQYNTKLRLDLLERGRRYADLKRVPMNAVVEAALMLLMQMDGYTEAQDERQKRRGRGR